MQENGFAAEQVDAPQAIFDVPDECQPRRTVGSGIAWPVVLPEHASNDVLVKLDAEGVSDLLGDAYATEPWIAALQLDDRRDEFGGRAFRAGFAAMRRGRKEYAVFAIDQGLVEFEQRCRLDERAELRNPSAAHEQRAQAKQDAIH